MSCARLCSKAKQSKFVFGVSEYLYSLELVQFRWNDVLFSIFVCNVHIWFNSVWRYIIMFKILQNHERIVDPLPTIKVKKNLLTSKKCKQSQALSKSLLRNSEFFWNSTDFIYWYWWSWIDKHQFKKRKLRCRVNL